MRRNPKHIDIEIDKLTNSIENVITGDSFKTDVSLIDNNDLKSITKKSGWLFNWKNEYKQPDRDVYKLTIDGNLDVIQGLIREPLDVDFFVDPKPLTEKEKNMISAFIKADKEKRRSKKTLTKGTYTQHTI
jgi:hypothetical protein